jgi:hypothetical protein
MLAVLPKAPSSNIQAPEKFQTSKTSRTRSLLELGASCFSGAWSLGFGALGIPMARLRALRILARDNPLERFTIAE